MISSLVRLVAHSTFLAIYLLNLIILFCLGAIWVFDEQSTWGLLKEQNTVFFGVGIAPYIGFILMALPLLAILGFFVQGALKRIRVATNTGSTVTLAPSAVEDCIVAEIRESDAPVRNVWVRASQKGFFGMGSKMHVRAEVTARLSQSVARTNHDVKELILKTLQDLYSIEAKDVTVLVVVTDVIPVKRRERNKPAGKSATDAAAASDKPRRLEKPANDAHSEPKPKVPKPIANSPEESTHKGSADLPQGELQEREEKINS
ncbi:MAG: hypothetical protein ACFCU1_00525 [Sumerlaeia bacterium]